MWFICLVYSFLVSESKIFSFLGLKVTRAHPQSIRKDLFRAILSATTPVVIWTRTDIERREKVNLIDEILTF